MADPIAASLNITLAPCEARGLICVGCGYDLQSIPSDKCPECGLTIDRASTIIPWVHRRRIGSWNAYWRTVRLATFHPAALAEEINFPQPWRDARLFRRVTATLAFIPLAITSGWILAHLNIYEAIAAWQLSKTLPPWFVSPAQPLETARVILLIAMEVGLWLAIYSATGIAGYLFLSPWKPVWRRNNAVVLSQYAAGALGLLPILLLPCLVVAWWIVRQHQAQGLNLIDLHVIELVSIPILSTAILWCYATARLLLQTTRQKIATFCLPIHLAVAVSVLLVIGPILLTAATAYLEIIWASFH